MNKRDIIVGFLILAGLAVLIFYWQKPSVDEELVVPQTLSLEDQIEDRFNLEIPEDVDKAEMKDVSGGNSSAIATRKYEDGKFTHTVLADLPDLEAGRFYEGWLVKGDEAISTGRLSVAKGGFLLEFSSSTDYPDYNQVVITSEEAIDGTPESHILEGSF